jgi:hypothetical protein
MTAKPKGPIWIDYSPALRRDMSIEQSVLVANLALNRLDTRALAEVFHDAGLQAKLILEDQEEAPHDPQA